VVPKVTVTLVNPVRSVAVLSWQLFTWEQIRPVQAPLLQSLATKHDCPSTQPGHGPPQSTSVSTPFLNPSPQVGSLHRPVVGLQKPVAQSLFN
jgi:hypothetical protein